MGSSFGVTSPLQLTEMKGFNTAVVQHLTAVEKSNFCKPPMQRGCPSLPQAQKQKGQQITRKGIWVNPQARAQVTDVFRCGDEEVLNVGPEVSLTATPALRNASRLREDTEDAASPSTDLD
ncbi:hypothetical protein SRHO_G00008080 [Serrasalmus rhombeus]